MILIIDTSSKVAVVATLNYRRTESFVSARGPELMPALRRIAASEKITGVAVGTGPGSFTGLRLGVSFGLGLAIGLGVPIVPLPSLALLAARSDEPVVAVTDAGRGRYYFLAPGRPASVGEAVEIPGGHPIVGGPGLVVPGHRSKSEDELRPYAEAAEILLRTANEVPYRSLRIEYMQSFTIPTKSEPSA